MTGSIHHPGKPETYPNDHQHAVEACEHAVDTLHNGVLSHARSLLDEARTAVEHAQHNSGVEQEHEIAYDCYD